MHKNIQLGICFKLLNCLLFSISSLIILYSVVTVSVVQILFARVSIGLVICFIYLKFINQKITFKLSAKDYYFYLTRAVISFLAMQLWVHAMKYIGITEATALSYTGPFWIFLAARYMIGESFNWRVLVIITANMIGVFIILHPKLNNLTWHGVAASLSSILLWVIYETICKKQTSSQHYMLQTFYVCFFTTIIISPFAFSEWQILDLKTWLVLSLLAILGVANITSLFLAYSFASMMILSPFSYARIIFTAFLTSILTHAVPNITVFIGSAIIIAVNSYVAYYTKKN